MSTESQVGQEIPDPDAVVRKRIAIGIAAFCLLLIVSPSFRRFAHNPIGATTNLVRSSPRILSTQSRLIEGYFDDDAEIRCNVGNDGAEGDVSVIVRLESGASHWDKRQTVRIAGGGSVNLTFIFSEYARGGGQYSVGLSETWFQDPKHFRPIGQ